VHLLAKRLWTLKVSSQKSHILSCDTLVANEWYNESGSLAILLISYILHQSTLIHMTRNISIMFYSDNKFMYIKTSQRLKFRCCMLQIMKIADVIFYVLAGFKFGVRVYECIFLLSEWTVRNFLRTTQTCRKK
jgi:hypothetical protein